MKEASFQSIRTHADGAIGIQVSRQLPTLSVAGDVTTVGGEGDSLAKGKVLKLKASALSVKAGGTIGRFSVGGGLRTTGDNIVTVEVEPLGRCRSAAAATWVAGMNSCFRPIPGTRLELVYP